MNYRSNVNDYELVYITQTELAIGIATVEDGNLIWLPKSQIQYIDDDYERNDPIWITIPDWLAKEHDLV
jgi:hypothetical protein